MPFATSLTGSRRVVGLDGLGRGVDQRLGREVEPGTIERRAAEIITLQKPDAFAAQDRRVFGGRDTLGDGFEPEAFGKAQQMAQENLAVRAAGEVVDERAVDFTVSTARLCKWRREVCPAPKSSSAT